MIKNEIEIKVIESSSKGNCICLFDGSKYLFLDFGSNIANTKNFYNWNLINKDKIAGALITHAHFDHIQSLNDELANNLNVYGTFDTFFNIRKNEYNKNIITNEIEENKKYKIENSNWSFQAFKAFHNIEGAVYFLIKNKKTKIVYLTDTEYVEEIKSNKKINGAAIYICEGNYGSTFVDDNKLKEQKHITNIVNHMNCEDVEQIIKNKTSNKTKLFIVSHVSFEATRFDVLDFIKNQYSNKNMKVEYLLPHKINHYTFNA